MKKHLVLFEDFITKEGSHPPIHALIYYADMKALYVIQPAVKGRLIFLQHFVKQYKEISQVIASDHVLF
jgi:hypothetical protein